MSMLMTHLSRYHRARLVEQHVPNGAVERLAAWITANGPIPTVRVSSAQARGAAKQYAYWGAVRYEVRLGRDGLPRNVALERASSDRRSHRLACQDAERLAEREDRYECQVLGRLTEYDADVLLGVLPSDWWAGHPDHAPLCDGDIATQAGGR